MGTTRRNGPSTPGGGVSLSGPQAAVCERTGISTYSKQTSQAASRDPCGETQLRAPSSPVRPSQTLSCEAPTEQGTRKRLLELRDGGRVSSLSPTHG